MDIKDIINIFKLVKEFTCYFFILGDSGGYAW